jgi:conjugal transfer pilin signal peptidase TrbI
MRALAQRVWRLSCAGLQGWKGSAWWLCWFIILPLAFAIKYQLTFNLTPSLPFKLAVVEKGATRVERGDLIAYRWHGGGPIPAGLEMVKRVAGVAGDRSELVPLALSAGEFAPSRSHLYELVLRSANGQELLRLKVKQYARTGQPIEPNRGGVVTKGHYFVTADHPDSLDSRYALTGLIGAEQLVGKVVWLW